MEDHSIWKCFSSLLHSASGTLATRCAFPLIARPHLKAAASAAEPSSWLAVTMLSPELDGWMAGLLAGWHLVDLTGFVRVSTDLGGFDWIDKDFDRLGSHPGGFRSM